MYQTNPFIVRHPSVTTSIDSTPVPLSSRNHHPTSVECLHRISDQLPSLPPPAHAPLQTAPCVHPLPTSAAVFSPVKRCHQACHSSLQYRPLSIFFPPRVRLSCPVRRNPIPAQESCRPPFPHSPRPRSSTRKDTLEASFSISEATKLKRNRAPGQPACQPT